MTKTASKKRTSLKNSSALELFHPCTQSWFTEVFDGPTRVQSEAWPAIAAGENTLLLAPTGSGKTLAAFLAAIDRIMFGEPDQRFENAVRVLYISPLKALGVDVDRNLKSPIIGLRTVAERDDLEFHTPRVAVRSGDTTDKERLQIARKPPEILITTPESLYLILTSKARDILKNVETVIIDEIHALAPTKRGTHLFLSLERLEMLRKNENPDIAPLQRIGLSATQRPLDEIARLLGGANIGSEPNAHPEPRPVNIINASEPKQFHLTVEVPVEDMTQLGGSDPIPEGPASVAPTPPSIWGSIHPRLVDLVREHHSTMIFVNSRRLAERLATAINELAEEEIAQAHHGSISKQSRELIEDRLKRGDLPAIVATSSLELGLDMGAVDLVIQIEAPPTIASGIQRIGRSGHQIGEPSTGVIFPKFRGDLLSCSAATGRMMAGYVEETHYPRNPLDVLAQQIVAMTALEPMNVDEIFSVVRQAAPYADLPRESFDGVLDLLSGRYPSNEFSELRPRINWDRLAGNISPRKGAQRLAILNGGTIADRGLYGVFLASDDGDNRSRVGELDEEMVFETRPGDVFLLGASSWRVMDITRDQVLVTPAPGEPGRMPFWRGEGPGRPLEFGKAIGQLSGELIAMPRKKAERRLRKEHALDELAAANLMDYLHDQAAATEDIPSDKTIVIESFLDEVGDWRIVVLSPFGTRVHAPWSMAVLALLQNAGFEDIDSMWADDGMVFRIPDTGELPPNDLFLPRSEDIEDLVIGQLGTSALFAARFRENAARALLLPRRQPNRRTPLWLQRKKSSDLLAVAARYKSFPILIETYRECLRDVFDLPGLIEILRSIEQHRIQVKTIESEKPSPFAGSLLFNYTANFIYDGDAPLAERRAQALSLDHAQLRALLGNADYRELLDAETVEAIVAELQRTGTRYTNHADDLHDLLLRLGDLSEEEIVARTKPEAVAAGHVENWLKDLTRQRRLLKVKIANETRYAAAEDAGRLRDGLGVVSPPGIPDAFLEPVADPLGDIILRFARTHGPFTLAELATRYGIGEAPLRTILSKFVESNRLVEGEFLPGKRGIEYCDADVLRTIKRRSLAKLRQQVEPVEQQALASFIPDWQHVTQPRRGLDGVLDIVEQLQGLPLPASEWELSILPARIREFRPSDLDELCAAGEIVWRGVDSIGTTDGRIALYLADNYQRLCPDVTPDDDELSNRIRELLGKQGALFFEQIHGVLGGFQNDVLETIWRMVWAGEVTNDTLTPLRSLRRQTKQQKSSGSRNRRRFRSRRQTKTPGSEGRWSLLAGHRHAEISATERQSAIAAQLVERYGIFTREMATSENLTGGFSAIYPVFKAMEEAGRIRRGYFVAGLGAAQFAAPGADDQIRHLSDKNDDDSKVITLAATDPANVYGLVVKWPETAEEVSAKLQRTVGAKVFLRNGHLLGYLTRNRRHLMSFLPEGEPDRTQSRVALFEAYCQLHVPGEAMLLAKIDGKSPAQTEFAELLQNAGFRAGVDGFIRPRNHITTRGSHA